MILSPRKETDIDEFAAKTVANNGVGEHWGRSKAIKRSEKKGGKKALSMYPGKKSSLGRARGGGEGNDLFFLPMD